MMRRGWFGQGWVDFWCFLQAVRPFTFVHCSAAVPALLSVFMHHVGVFGVCADVSCLHVRVDGGAG